jgi:hypothetical protein
MATGYTSNLGLALPVTGDLSGTWGATVNTGITQLLDDAVAGTTSITASITLSDTQGATNEARQSILLCSASLLANITITAPARSKIYTVINLSPTYTVKIQGGASTGITIPVSSTATVAWNGTDFVDASGYINGNLRVNGNTTLGDADTDTITVNSQFVTGTQLKSAKTATNTLSLAAYDVDGTAYTNLITLTASNTPTLALTSTGVGTMNNITIGNTAAAAGTFTSVTNSGLTSGRVTYASTGGLLTDSANLAFDGTNLGVGGTTNSYGSQTTLTLSGTNVSRIDFRSNSTYTGTILSYQTVTEGLRLQTEAGYPIAFYPAGTLRASISAAGVFSTTLGATIQGLTVGLGNASASATSTAVGISALVSSSGTDATAFGYFAGENLTSGAYSIAIGSRAMGGTTGGPNTGSYNTAIGNSALAQNTNGNRNIAIGNEALGANQGGTSNVAVGSYAAAAGDAVLALNVSGNYNTAVGAATLAKNTTSFNTAFGYSAGFYTSSGGPNTYIGAYAGFYCTTGTNNVAVGYGSLSFGIVSGYSTGSFNTAIGDAALYALSSGSQNVAVGYHAGLSVSSAIENTYVGYYSGRENTGNYNTALGNLSLGGTAGSGGFNTAIGRSAMQVNTSGAYNTAVGMQALSLNAAGPYNTAVGYQAAYNYSGANGVNTIIGAQAMLSATSSLGNYANVIVGYQAGYNQNGTTAAQGIYNTFVGTGAGAQMTTGSKNIIIGCYNGNTPGVLDIRTASNYIVLSDGDGNVPLYLDGSSGGRPWFTYTAGSRATFKNTYSTPYGLYVLYSTVTPNNTGSEFLYCDDSTTVRATIRSNGGIANYSANDVNLSDRREKTNFAPAKSYLDVICSIPVQTFNYIDQNMVEDGGLTLGVVAQDVQAVAPELVMESNWAKADDEPKMRLSIYQTDLQYALMKCIQEQQAIITQLTARITALEGASA